MEGAGRGVGDPNESINAMLGPLGPSTKYMRGENREADLEHQARVANERAAARLLPHLLSMIARCDKELQQLRDDRELRYSELESLCKLEHECAQVCVGWCCVFVGS